jgi:hypothetical protein
MTENTPAPETAPAAPEGAPSPIQEFAALGRDVEFNKDFMGDNGRQRQTRQRRNRRSA